MLVASCVAASASAEPLNCRRAPPAHEVLRYERVHDVTLHRVLSGPDALQYERDDVVQALDELIVWRPAPDAACVVLTLYDRNGVECDVAGLAAAAADGAHALITGDCALRFELDPERVHLLAPSAACSPMYCMRGGVLEGATLLRK
jgi:hypothetical protein